MKQSVRDQEHKDQGEKIHDISNPPPAQQKGKKEGRKERERNRNIEQIGQIQSKL